MRTESFWEEDVFGGKISHHSREEVGTHSWSGLISDKKADVVIAGAGFAGLWSAFHLKTTNPALNITVLEKEPTPAGASTRNAGFACFGSLTELVDDLAFMGEPKMKEMVRMRYSGLQQIQNTFESSEIDYQQLGGYELISAYQYPDEEMLTADINEINKVLEEIIDRNPVFSLSDEAITRFGFAETDHLVQNKLEGQLHPGKLLFALLQKVKALGVEVVYGTGVSEFLNDTPLIQISTESGQVFHTSKFLICTNALAGELSQQLEIIPARGQVLLTSPIEDLPFTGCFHYDEGYYYFRNLDGRILLGGARNMAIAEEETTEMITTDTIQNELENFLREIVIPGKEFTIEKRWSGIMGMAETKFPIVRELEENIYCAVGMGGIGIAIAPEVGKMIAGIMVTRQQ